MILTSADDIDVVAEARDGREAEEARRRLSALTEREPEVPALLGEGPSSAGAGARLHMSEATVKTYVSRTLTRLDCDNRVPAGSWPASRAWSRPADEPGQRSRRPLNRRGSPSGLSSFSSGGSSASGAPW